MSLCLLIIVYHCTSTLILMQFYLTSTGETIVVVIFSIYFSLRVTIRATKVICTGRRYTHTSSIIKKNDINTTS